MIGLFSIRGKFDYSSVDHIHRLASLLVLVRVVIYCQVFVIEVVGFIQEVITTLNYNE